MPGGAGRDAAAKVCSIVAGMLTGADSITDLGVLRELTYTLHLRANSRREAAFMTMFDAAAAPPKAA